MRPGSERSAVAAGQTVIGDLALTPVAVTLSEMVSTGYGTQRAGNITGAVTKVSTDEFNTGRIVSPEQLIESKVAGVQVIDNNEPGGGISHPDSRRDLDQRQQRSALRHRRLAGRHRRRASRRRARPPQFPEPERHREHHGAQGGEAASIYGANAANGVVLIKTKSGRPGATQFEYTTSVSASQVTRLPSMLNAAQFAAAVKQYAPQNVSQLQSANTDWFAQIDRTGVGQEHNLSVSGAGQSNAYRLSLGYLNQDGIIKASTTERVSAGTELLTAAVR